MTTAQRTAVRCRGCQKMLGDFDGERLIITRIGLILRGGLHSWTCLGCGETQDIDLRDT